MPLNITFATTVTAQDLITRAARSLAYLGRTETIGAADTVDAIETMNAMLDSWNAEGLMSYVGIQRSFPLVVGTQVYTIGAGGMVNVERPSDILSAYIRDSNNLDYPMSVITQDEWIGIGQKTITSQIPTTLFYYSTYPLGEINIFPVPMLPYTLFYISTLDQVQFTTLTQALAMPLGYERAIISNLAVEMMGAGFPCMLPQTQLAALVAIASESKANVKRTNIKEVVADYDDAIVARSYATYNIYSDGNPRR